MKEEKTIVSKRFMPTLLAIEIATNMAEVRRRGKYKFPIYMSKDFCEQDIECLELGARANNCLRRVGIHTVGELVENIECDEDLKRIRNCGKNSIQEIMLSLICCQYERMSVEKRKRFVNRTNELNWGSQL